MKVFTDTTRLNQLIEHIQPNSIEFVKAVGFQVEAIAKMKAPVDTGALRNSIYVATPEANNPPAVAEETLPNPPKQSVYVGPSVEYGIYQELGTSTVEAQAYMLPALREVERQLEGYARTLINE